MPSPATHLHAPPPPGTQAPAPPQLQGTTMLTHPAVERGVGMEETWKEGGEERGGRRWRRGDEDRASGG
nr:unnamed protein product [Digitaria exilis]